MKMLCWLLGGYPSIEENEKILDVYVKSGCEGVEWSIPVSNPYREQDHLKDWALEAYRKCPDYKKHLESIERFVKKYPNVEVYPGIYYEMTKEVGIEYIIDFFRKNKIDTIFLVGDYPREYIEKYREAGINLTESSVSYYLTDSELKKAKDGNGFIYMQAMPYSTEIEAGYTTDRLKECIEVLKKECPGRPIYCAKGIRKPEDLKVIYHAGADGYILGSLLVNEYDSLEGLEKTIVKYKTYSNDLERGILDGENK